MYAFLYGQYLIRFPVNQGRNVSCVYILNDLNMGRGMFIKLKGRKAAYFSCGMKSHYFQRSNCRHGFRLGVNCVRKVNDSYFSVYECNNCWVLYWFSTSALSVIFLNSVRKSLLAIRYSHRVKTIPKLFQIR